MSWRNSWRISIIGAVLFTSLLAVVDSSEARCRRRCRRGGCGSCYSSCNYGGGYNQCNGNQCYSGGYQGCGAPMQGQPMPLPPQANRAPGDWGLDGANQPMQGRQPTNQTYAGPTADNVPAQPNPERLNRGTSNPSPTPPAPEAAQ
jgi:hypothetical protein